MPQSLRLPALFANGCVLQRGGPVPVWGWAAPGASVRAACAGSSATATTGADGRWRLDLPELPAGGPYVLEVAAAAETVRVGEVLVGEVWLASGQSNMDLAALNAGYSVEELTDLDQPQVRFFVVQRRGTARPQDDTTGEWLAATGGAVGHASGAALACALRLHRRLGVAVGIIQASVGGTGAEWWTRREVLDAHPDLRPLMDQLRQKGGGEAADTPAAQAALAAWKQAAFHQDPGISSEAQGWSAPGFADAAWESMPLPCTWESQGHLLDGASWSAASARNAPTPTVGSAATPSRPGWSAAPRWRSRCASSTTSAMAASSPGRCSCSRSACRCASACASTEPGAIASSCRCRPSRAAPSRRRRGAPMSSPPRATCGTA